jgi:AcrR family transcriptional regulator
MTLEQTEPVESNLGRPLRADAERNRRRILAAAAEVFAKRGLEAGLDEIARHAGVGTGTVYRRFPEKTMLIEALFESRLDDIIALADEAAEMPDAWEGLVHFTAAAVEMQQADHGLKELLFSQNAHLGPDRFAHQKAQLTPRMNLLVERAKASGQLRADVELSDLAMVQFMLHSVGKLAGRGHPDLWRRQLALLLDGLRAGGNNTPLPGKPVTEAAFEAMCQAAAVELSGRSHA